jgi:hypothetical protein
MRMFKLLLIVVTLFGCTSKPKEKGSINKDGVPRNKTEISTLPENNYLNSPDSVLIPSFEVEIVLSERAKQRLLNSKESIIVFAEFTGEPADTVSEGLNESGELMLKSVTKETYAPWIVRLDNIFIPVKMYERLRNKDYEVSVQVWTGRRSSEYNLVTGDLIYGPISKIKGIRHKLNAKLIEEQ